MKFILFLIALSCIGTFGFGQSFFKPVNPRGSQQKATPFHANASVFTGTDTWLFRPIVSIASYSITSNALSTGAGIAYELIHQDPTTKVASSVVSISGLLCYNLQLDQSKSNKPIAGELFLGLFNNHLLVGGKYDLHQLDLQIGTAINFNN